MEQPQIGTETPAPPMSLREHIAAEAEPRPVLITGNVVKIDPADPVDAKPEEEAASAKPDADVSEAARTLRRNRADERRVQLKREVDDSLRERADARANHERELARERAELESIRQERAQLTRGEQPRRPATTGATHPVNETTDPNDPAPLEENYQDWGQFRTDEREWIFRESARRAERNTRERIAREAQERTAKALDEKSAAVREKYADFDAAIDTVLTRLHGNQRARAVAAFMAASDVGGEMGYRLGKDDAALKAVLEAETPIQLGSVLERLASQITASLKTPKPVTKAPAPPSQTVGGRAAATDPDTNTAGFSTAEHRRIENAAIAERRARGLRN